MEKREGNQRGRLRGKECERKEGKSEGSQRLADEQTERDECREGGGAG